MKETEFPSSRLGKGKAGVGGGGSKKIKSFLANGALEQR